MYGDPEMVGGRRDVIPGEAPITRAQALASIKKGPDLKAARRSAAIALAKKKGLPVYESNYSRLMIQVASPRDFPDVNGRVRTLQGIRAKFNFGLYTPFSSLRPGTEEHKKEVALIIEAMESHPNFGLGKLFWRAEDKANLEKEIHYQEAVKLLSEDEELRSRFLAQLSSGEIDASVIKTQARRKDAILAARGGDEVRPRNAPTSLEDEKDKRASILEKAERSLDEKAQRLRAAAEGTDIPRKKKKKKLHRHSSEEAL